ncbi:MAG: hypothetical protein ABIJ96_12210 [Elusimicrobiota bacterium]
MKRVGHILILLSAALICAGAVRYAAANYRPSMTYDTGTVPGGINFQGRLANDGTAVTGQRNLVFRLYDAAEGGTLLWQSLLLSTQFEEGIFGVTLDIPTDALMGAGMKYLEFEVNNIILLPREPLRPVPYARIAEVVEGSIDISSGSLAVSTAALDGNAIYASSAAGSVGFGTTQTQAGQIMRVDAGDWSVGYPTNSNPSAQEDIFIEGNIVIGGILIGGPGFSNRVELLVVSTETNSGERAKIGEGYLTVLDSGRVGISSITPGAPLGIDANTVPAVQLNHATQSQLRLTRAGSSRLVAEGGVSISTLGTVAADDLILEANSVEVLRVTSGGRVGISSAVPTAALGVEGSANVSLGATLGTPLAVVNGGTGGATAAAARTALDLPSRTGSDASGSWAIDIVAGTAGTGSAATFDAYVAAPSVCATASYFSTGIAANGDAVGCAYSAESADLSEASVEPVIYDNDNILRSPWEVASAGAYDIFFDSPTFYIDVSANRVGISTRVPPYTLHVEDGDIDTSGKIQEDNADLIPAGAITFSTIPAGCPSGWSEFTAARGFMIAGLPGMVVGSPATGTPGGAVGVALGDQATLTTHAHDLSNHTHTFDTPAHSHTPGVHSHQWSAGVSHNHTISDHQHWSDPIGNHQHSGPSHTHSMDPPWDDLPDNDDTFRVGGSACSPANCPVVISDHWHGYDASSLTSDAGGTGNTGLTDPGGANSSSDGSVGTGNSNYIPGIATSGAPSANSTDTETMSGTSGGPDGGLNTTSTDNNPTAPYLQLWVCQKT